MASPERKNLLRPLGSKAKTPGRTPRDRGDRFIPARNGTDIENAGLLDQLDTSGSEFQTELAKQLSVGDHRLLSFKSSVQPFHQHRLKSRMSLQNSNLMCPQQKSAGRTQRYIHTQPDRILDAPELQDDFYLNLLDWGAQNKLAVGLGPCMYIWDAATGDVQLYREFDDSLSICSVKWTESGTHLAVGMSDATIQIHDVAANKQLRCLRGHTDRVNAITWCKTTLTSGGRGAGIMNSDVRKKQHNVAVMNFHTQEICGLAWAPRGQQLASGANDNMLAIWDARGGNEPEHIFSDHKAAVKAIAWSPHCSKLLASGGGSADHHVRFWNTSIGESAGSIDAKSQVCSLVWNPHEKEILGGLGYSDNQLALWRYPSCNLVTELRGHQDRVLHMTISPDGCTVCSGAADESLRFWKIFELPPSKKPEALKNANRAGVFGTVNIR